jgi:DNA methylase
MHLYKTTSNRLAGDVQELLLKLGHSASVSRVSVTGREQWRPIWNVTRRTSVETTIFPTKHGALVPYDGWVYCCTVEPHHTLVVRRNGRPAVCGNCWWHTIVPPGGKERTGYPTQKPLGILRRIVPTSSPPGGLVADFFAGSGTTGIAAHQSGRLFLLVDNSPEAATVMARRFATISGIEYEGFAP